MTERKHAEMNGGALTDQGWEKLPEWLREHWERFGPDDISSSGWTQLVREPGLPIQVLGRSIYFVGAGPRHGEELCYWSAHEPDEPDEREDPDDPELRQMGLGGGSGLPLYCSEEESGRDGDEEYPMRGRVYLLRRLISRRRRSDHLGRLPGAGVS